MSFKVFLFFICLTSLSGCVTYNGFKPVGPEVSTVIWDLQPTFRWEPAGDENIKYDFIVYESLMKDSKTSSPGKVLYYREGLERHEHRIEKALKPGNAYYWSVRGRKGELVSPWSGYNLWLNSMLGQDLRIDRLYEIRIVAPQKMRAADSLSSLFKRQAE